MNRIYDFQILEIVDLEVKIEYNRANESNRDFCMCDNSSDHMEKEYDTGDESMDDLGGSRDFGGSLHLPVNANLSIVSSIDDNRSRCHHRQLLCGRDVMMRLLEGIRKSPLRLAQSVRL